MGLPVASDMDGRVIQSAFSSEYVAERPRQVVGDYATAYGRTIATPEEQQSLEKQLRALGYIR